MTTIASNSHSPRRERSLLRFSPATGQKPILAFLFLLLIVVAVAAQPTAPTANRAWEPELEQALGVYGDGDSARAAQVLEAAIKKHGEIPDLMYWLGCARYKQRQYDEALKSFKRFCEIEPSNAEGPRWVASTYQQQRKPALAIIWYEKALKIDPANSEADAGLKRAKQEEMSQNQQPQSLQNSGAVSPESGQESGDSTKVQATKAPTDWKRILKVGYARALKREHASPMFFIGDFVELRLFAFSIASTNTELKLFLWQQLSPGTQDKLQQYNQSRTDPKGLEASLVQELNRLIQAGPIYSKERFKGTSIATETRALALKKPEGPDLVQLNRMLLSDAFSEAFSPSKRRLLILGVVWVLGSLFLVACVTSVLTAKFRPPLTKSESIKVAVANSCIGAASGVFMWGSSDLMSLLMVGTGMGIGLLVSETSKEIKDQSVGGLALSLFTLISVIKQCMTMLVAFFLGWLIFLPSFLVALILGYVTGWNAQYIFVVVGIIQTLILMLSKKLYFDIGYCWMFFLPWIAILAHIFDKPSILGQ